MTTTIPLGPYLLGRCTDPKSAVQQGLPALGSFRLDAGTVFLCLVMQLCFWQLEGSLTLV